MNLETEPWPAWRLVIGSWQQPIALEVDNNQLRAIIKADPLTTTQEVAQELSVHHSMLLWHLKQIGKVNKLNKWVPPEVNEKQKSCHLDVLSSLILHNNNEPFLKWIVMYYKKVDFIMTISDDQLSVLTKKKLQSTSQSQMFTKKSSLSLFVGLLLVWSTTAFWIAVKPLHLRSMLSKSMRYTQNCIAFKPALVNRKGANLL